VPRFRHLPRFLRLRSTRPQRHRHLIFVLIEVKAGDKPKLIQADHLGNYLVHSEFWPNSRAGPNLLPDHARFAGTSHPVRIGRADSLESVNRES